VPAHNCCSTMLPCLTSEPYLGAGESNVKIVAKIGRCWLGVSPTTPGLTSRPLKKPPSLPRESSQRCSRRKIVLLHPYRRRYSSVVVKALAV
jgi:hypothetical protein